MTFRSSIISLFLSFSLSLVCRVHFVALLQGLLSYNSFRKVDRHGLLETFESTRIHAAALVVGCHSDETSHWEASQSLSDWMKQEGVPGISGN